MADNDNSIEGRPPDPFVAARINDPGAPAPASFQLAGLLGDSERDGYRRLYLNTALDYYVEFRTEDVLAVESVTPDQPPFVGLDATRVSLNRDAAVEYVHSRPASADGLAADGFAVDARAGLPGGLTPDTDLTFPTGPTGTLPTDFTTIPNSIAGGCVPDTLPPGCQLDTVLGTCGNFCVTHKTCQITQCNTCGNATCRTCFGGTCQTCDDATCQTCNQVTCATCASCLTCNNGPTCNTCNTCLTCNNGVTCHTCVPGRCWPTIAGATCLTCKITVCNWNCQQSVAVPCVTQNGCPTLACP